MAVGAPDAGELGDGHGLVVGERDGSVGVGRVDHAVVGRHEDDVAVGEILRERHGLLAAAVDAAVDAARTAPIAAARVVDALALRVELAAQTAAMAAAAAFPLRTAGDVAAVWAAGPAAGTAGATGTAAIAAGRTTAGGGGGRGGRSRRVRKKGEGAMALMALDEDADGGDDDDSGEGAPVQNEIDEIHAVESVDGLMTPRCKLDTPHNHERELQSKQKEERECINRGDPPR